MLLGEALFDLRKDKYAAQEFNGQYKLEPKKVNQLFVAPGNAGTDKLATNININPTDFEAVKTIVLENDIKMVVVGPEAPLVEGVHDFFLADKELKNIPVIGPKKDGALLEGSKDFSKQFMQWNI